MKLFVEIDVRKEDRDLPLYLLLEKEIEKLKKESKPNPIGDEVFEELWLEWPKKTDKKRAREKFKSKIRSEKKLELFRSAFANYLESCGDDEKYILHFATFMNRWEGYLPEEITPEKGLVFS